MEVLIHIYVVAAKIAGIDKIYKVGGAQAVGGLSLWNRNY